MNFPFGTLVALLAGASLLAAEPSREISDRLGAVLVTADGRHPQGSLAAHVLAFLDTDQRPIRLTLDSGLQAEVERILSSVERGAAVVIDPATGDILAMASVPTFKPEDGDRAALATAEPDPLRNRAITHFAPGAAFLPVTGLIGLSQGLADQRFSCTGGVTYGNHYMKCWIANSGSHGPLTLTEALAASCGPFFFQYGNAAGIDAITTFGARLGFGQKTGVPLRGESAGILPGPAWLAANHPRDTWRDGYTANVSIGQGFNLTTPLQLAAVTATIANGGTVRPPRLVLTDAIPPGDNIIDAKLTREALELVRRGMWETVNGSGGGQRARIDGIEVAGRTGTAQNLLRLPDGQIVKDNHTWFLAFAPYDRPQFAVVVLAQGAKSSGQVAAPLAREILQAALKRR